MNARRQGFTLVELTFALLLVALGLLAIFHLFPSGLRASVDANAFTRQAQFGSDFMGAVRAAAAENWDSIFAPGMEVTLGDGTTTVALDRDWDAGAFEYPVDSGEYMRGKASVSRGGYLNPGSQRAASVTLDVRYGRVGTAGERFYTEIFNFGM